MNDIVLLQRARGLDEAALAEIHDRYYQAVYRYFSFRVPDVQTAEDLTSEVFVRFLGAIRDRQAPPNSLKGWLFGAARNVAREYYRHTKKMSGTAVPETLPSTEPTPHERLALRLDVQALDRAMRELTDDQRHVLALRFGGGLPIREVADMMNKSEAAVKMLQARAVMALSKEMDSQRQS